MSEDEYRTTIITFNPFFRRSEIKGKSDSYISRKTGIDISTLKKMRKHNDVPSDVIGKICQVLECQPGDIMEAGTIYVIPAKDIKKDSD